MLTPFASIQGKRCSPHGINYEMVACPDYVLVHADCCISGRSTKPKLVGPHLHHCIRQPPIEIAPARYRPPIVEKDFDRSPIGYPAHDDQAFLEIPRQLRRAESPCDQL